MEAIVTEKETMFMVTLEGEMDTVAAAEVEKKMQPLYATGGKDVYIDCERLEYIASSGLRILLCILKGAKDAGSRVVLRKVNDDIMSVFKMTGLNKVFEFE